jgi:uncharacterized membrane protein YdfJ with MMPL/SSD domain
VCESVYVSVYKCMRIRVCVLVYVYVLPAAMTLATLGSLESRAISPKKCPSLSACLCVFVCVCVC